MAKQYISLKTIVDKALRHPLMTGISFEAIIDYCVDFMRIVKCPNIFQEKYTTFEIKDYRSTEDLPEDFYEVIQVKSSNVHMRYSTDSFHVALPYDSKGALPEDYVENSNREGDFTYKIQGNKIYTSFRDGTIEMSYMAMPIDEEGYPMIPDNSKFTRALEAYIKKQWFTILFDLGKLQPQILQNTQQEYAWAVGACESEFKHLTLDKAESFYNMWRSSLMGIKQYSVGFNSLGGTNKKHSTRPYVKPVILREKLNEDGTTTTVEVDKIYD